MLINPQLSLSITPCSLTVPSKRALPLYKKSKKRVKAKDLDRSNKNSPMPAKKLDLEVAISGLSKEMKRARKAKETHQTS
jgi:hypothetical protein